jgi:hypothetical protein
MLDALDEAEDKAKDEKDENILVKGLQPFVEKSNERFFKPLSKYAKHRASTVRVMAVRALGSQKEPQKKVVSTLSSLLMWRGNKDDRFALAMIVDSLRRQKCDKKQVIDECIDHFRKQLHPEIMKACAHYFGDMKLVETVDMLVFWYEAPQPANVNSGTNPPASYWKRMWEIWSEIKDAVKYALENITGKSFDTKRDWENWTRTLEAERMGVK